ncbi:MAG: S41 family peptidase [Bacteroidota bacterium]
MRVLLVLLAVLAMPASGQTTPGWQPTLTEAGVDPSLHGVWQSRGYGWVFEVGPDGAMGYDVSATGCLEPESQTPEEVASWARVFRMEGRALVVSTQPENATRYTFDPISAVPEACGAPLGASAQEVFDYAWTVMDEHYAFFDLFGVDWDARRSEIAPRIRDGMSEPDLFDALVDLLDGLNDAHLVLQGEVDGESRRHRGKGAAVLGPLLQTAFEAQDEVASMGAFANAWFAENQRRIQDEVLDDGTVVTVGDDDIVWGRRGRIGYLFVTGMSPERFAPEAPIEAQIDSVHAVLDRALTDLSDTDALVLDVALNQGGSDRVGLAIASHFANAPSTGLTKVAYGPEAAAPQPIAVVPASGVRYLKPVSVLTTGVTLSSAETFVLQMRALPTVTHIGEVTRGALSDVLFKPLPNGWMLRLSNEIYRDAEGELWEGRGIAPDVPVTVFSRGDLAGHTTALAGVMDWLGRTLES